MLDGKFGVPVNGFLDVMDEKFDKNIDWIFRVTNFQAFELGLGKLFHSFTVSGRPVDGQWTVSWTVLWNDQETL